MRFTPGENGYRSIFLDFNAIELTEDYKFLVNEDCGKVFSSSIDLTLSLPLIEAGNTLTLFNTGLNGRCELALKPFHGNGILYRGNGKAYKNLINTRETQQRGDYIKLASLNPQLSEDNLMQWQVIESRGIWEHGDS